jgi:phosphatidylglycerol:prolipoprotein diacylglycerol transferase
MRPLLVNFSFLQVQSYPFILLLSLLLGVFVSALEARRFNISPQLILMLSIPTIFSALLGARFFYLISNFDFTLNSFLYHGGIGFYGGLISGALCLLFLAYRNKIPWEALFSATSPGLSLAHALGRLGCLLKGCCYGKKCDLPWAIYYQDPFSKAPTNIPLHPSQVYEIIGLIIISIALFINNRKPLKKGLKSWKIYLFSYAFLRFFNEFTRGDPSRGQWGALSPSQWISIAIILVLLLLDFLGARIHKGAHETRS